MNLVDLILTVCLISSPTTCRQEHLLFESDGSLAHCMFHAPSEIAKWSVKRPMFRIISWKCAFPGQNREI